MSKKVHLRPCQDLFWKLLCPLLVGASAFVSPCFTAAKKKNTRQTNKTKKTRNRGRGDAHGLVSAQRLPCQARCEPAVGIGVAPLCRPWSLAKNWFRDKIKEPWSFWSLGCPAFVFSQFLYLLKHRRTSSGRLNPGPNQKPPGAAIWSLWGNPRRGRGFLFGVLLDRRRITRCVGT